MECEIAGGADIIELGVPFSDPFADGAVIRSAAYEALRQGMTLSGVLEIAARLRAKHPETGLVLFSYYNLIFSMGLEKFAAAAAAAGIDAVLSVDLPFEEREELLSVLRPHGLGHVPLIAPNTPIERVVESAKDISLLDAFLAAFHRGNVGTGTPKKPYKMGLFRGLSPKTKAVQLPTPQ